jgi:hypothetical protein
MAYTVAMEDAVGKLISKVDLARSRALQIDRQSFEHFGLSLRGKFA